MFIIYVNDLHLIFLLQRDLYRNGRSPTRFAADRKTPADHRFKAIPDIAQADRLLALHRLHIKARAVVTHRDHDPACLPPRGQTNRSATAML